MREEKKQEIIATIVHREKLRPLGRLERLRADPLRAFPYYILAAASHIKPFKISWKTLWGDTMTGYMPETNTFYYYGYCEANLTSFLLRFLKPGDTFMDVGAHIGFYSVLASRLVAGNSQKKGMVYSFEPTPWTYELLQKNTSALGNVMTINAGMSDASGETTFSDYGPGYGAYNSASAEGTILKFQPKKVKVRTVVFDEFCRKNGAVPDFIKLDAEGFEHKILSGMKETLRDARPFITLEMANGELWSKNCRESADILLAAGYESFEMTDDGYVKRSEAKKLYQYSNILFSPCEKTQKISNLIQ